MSIFPVVFAPDGALLAAVDIDGTPIVWNVVSGKRGRDFEKDAESSADCLAFSTEGRTLVSAGWAGNVLLRDVATGELRSSFSMAFESAKTTRISKGVFTTTYPCSSVVISQNATRVASVCHSDGQTRIWNVATGVEEFVFATQDQSPLAFSSDGRLLALANSSGEIAVVDLNQGVSSRVIGRRPDSPSSAVFSPDGKILATADGSTVVLWDVDRGEDSHTLSGHDENVDAIAFAPSGNRLASSCGHETSYPWWTVLTGKSFIFAEYPGQLRLWDVRTGHELDCIVTEACVDSMMFSPDGKTLATGFWEGMVIVWELPATGNLLRKSEQGNRR
jgi:WD40 repeat protein